MPITVRLLGPDEATILDNVAADVFDHAIDPRLCAEFFADPRHHLVVALDHDLVVGMASGVHYVHPDKPPQLFINEVAVAATHHSQGIGRRLVATLVAHGEAIGCDEAWVLTSPDNEPAKRMYRAAGAIPDEELSIMFTYRMRPRRDHG
jgi:ribosomal protein S18 acetylase RimI-like enzyme